MRVRRYNYYALAQPGVLFNAPEGGDGGAGGDAAAQAAAAQAATDAAAKTATDEAAAKTAADVKAAADAKAGAAGEGLPDDVALLKAEIGRLRKENGDTRALSKANAATEAKAEFAQEMGKLLGLIKSDEPPTVEALTKEITTAKTDARSAQVELAVYKASGAHQANPTALLDSRSFLAKVAELDPSKKDFDTKVADAIKDAVKDHPELKATLAAVRNSVNHTGGTGEGANKPQTLDQATAGHYGG